MNVEKEVKHKKFYFYLFVIIGIFFFFFISNANAKDIKIVSTDILYLNTTNSNVTQTGIDSAAANLTYALNTSLLQYVSLASNVFNYNQTSNWSVWGQNITYLDSTIFTIVNTTNIAGTRDGMRVGIGTENPQAMLHINTGGVVTGIPNFVRTGLGISRTNAVGQGVQIGLVGGTTSNVAIQFGDTANAVTGKIQYENSGDKMIFHTGFRDMVEITLADVVINEDSNKVDFRVESDTNDYQFFVNGTSGNVSIGTNKGTHNLNVVGSVNVTGTLIYGALLAQSPHALINKNSDGTLRRTEICIVADDGTVILFYMKKVGSSYTFVSEPNSQICLDKETAENDIVGYKDIITDNGTIQQEAILKQKNKKVFG